MRRKPARPISADDDDVLKDGESVIVPLQMMDSRDHRTGMAVGTWTDANGRPDPYACNRPGYRFVKGNDHLDHVRAAAAFALDQRSQATADAWKNPDPQDRKAALGQLTDTERILRHSTSAEDVRAARQRIDAQAWRNPPQMPAGAFDASRRSSSPSRALDASTPAAAWPSIKRAFGERMAEAETEDLQAEANTAREARNARDREAWRGG
jgi:hypothetical protein